MPDREQGHQVRIPETEITSRGSPRAKDSSIPLAPPRAHRALPTNLHAQICARIKQASAASHNRTLTFWYHFLICLFFRARTSNVCRPKHAIALCNHTSISPSNLTTAFAHHQPTRHGKPPGNGAALSPCDTTNKKLHSPRFPCSQLAFFSAQRGKRNAIFFFLFSHPLICKAPIGIRVPSGRRGKKTCFSCIQHPEPAHCILTLPLFASFSPIPTTFPARQIRLLLSSLLAG